MKLSSAYRPSPKQTYIAREGYPFIAIAIGAGLLLWMTGLAVGSFLLLCMAGFVAFFFRNPNRSVPEGKGLVFSPADGRIVKIQRCRAPYTDEDAFRVSIFMSVFNVHINRIPVSARVERVAYHPGRFLVATRDKASELNERNVIVLTDEEGRRFSLVQIAGLIARRIVCYVKEGDFLNCGERMGLIRFGSRVDLYLPAGAKIEVGVGDRVRGGETIIGRFE